MSVLIFCALLVEMFFLCRTDCLIVNHSTRCHIASLPLVNWQLWPICLGCMWRGWLKMCELCTTGIHRQPADLQRSDGTTPTCAGLPPQPHPKHLIKRDTLSTWSRMKRKLLAHAVHLGSSTENSPDWSTIRYTARTLERSLWHNLHFRAGNWSFGDVVDGDVSCRGPISLPVCTISTDGCLSCAWNTACMSLSAEVDSSRWMNVGGKITVISPVKLYCSKYPNIKVTLFWLCWFI